MPWKGTWYRRATLANEAVSSSWASIVDVVGSGGLSSAWKKPGSGGDGALAAKLAASVGVLPGARHGSQPAMSPPPGTHGTACPPNVSALVPLPPTRGWGTYGRCTGSAPSTPGHKHAASPIGTSRASFT